MDWIEALILGLIQGLTEFLPVSSSGHLEFGKVIFNIEAREDLSFAIVVHGATVLSIIIVFFKDIVNLCNGFFKFKWNESTQYIFKIIVSIIPVGIVGVFFKEQIKLFFTGNVMFVGAMLIITSFLLAITYYSKQKQKNISFINAFIIGIAQAFAVLPGISRSGATIATGLLLGTKRENIAKFSFLMVLIPVILANLLELFQGDFSHNNSVGIIPLMVGFFSAFISGLFACRWMINIVKSGKLIYFAVYCFLIGLIALLLA